MNILAIDTSCDETAVAVTSERKVLSNVIYSQVLAHKQWGGVVPSIAKRAHEERIDFVIEEALSKFQKLAMGSGRRNLDLIWKNIDYIAVTYGPGLAIALEVGIKKAKELAQKYNKKIIPVNHMEGHIYSCFVQNSAGKPTTDFNFPYLALLISGGHTELVLFESHISYKVLGATIDDAVGEALDKAARLLGFGYPGGAVIEELAARVNNEDIFQFTRPMSKSKDLNFSYSGLKTALLYKFRTFEEEEKPKQVAHLASSFQEAAFCSLLKKTEMAMKQTGVTNLIVGGGVIANRYLRKIIRELIKKNKGSVLFPPYKYLTGDNAAMIGVAAFYKAQQGMVVLPDEHLDRVPRLSL